jgi:hypothetical protein
MRSWTLVLIVATLTGACAAPAAAPSPSVSHTPSPSPTPTSPPSTAPASPTAPLAGTYVNYALGFSLQMPGPWRRSDCLSSRDYSMLPAADSFVRVAEQDERATDVGYAFEAVSVSVESNPNQRSARDWVAQGALGSWPGQTIENGRLDGRDAVVVRPTAALAVAYVVPIADRIFVVGYHNALSDQSQVATMERMVATFHVLTEQERAAAPSQPAPAPRSAAMVANILADGFAHKDAVLLGTVMAPCMETALERAGASSTPRNVFITQLADGFAKGLQVAVSSSPIEADGPSLFVRATWNQPGVDTQRRDLYLSRTGDVWSWYLTLTRQPVR